MKYLAVIAALALLPFAAQAQQTQEEEDKGYLTTLIEDNLGGTGREVDIQGFEGALSSAASIERMTIADSEGVWLTLEDVVLDWNRSALLRGAIDVDELSAARVIVARPPVSKDDGPTPEAKPFSLPELPVSISLDKLNIELIELGEAFLGEPVAVSLTGTAQLADGEGSANVLATRLGDKRGIFEINGSYANATRNLDLLLNVEEGQDGIVARLIELPGRPSIKLQLSGDAPINDYTANLAIATDGQDRLSGEINYASDDATREIAVDITGDISPLFAAEYGAFFGNDASLQLRIDQAADGSVSVPQLALEAGRIALGGSLEIGGQGWPQRIDLQGGITAVGSEPVLLPLSGPKTFVDGMDLSVSYDAALSDDWRANLAIDGLTRPGLTIATVGLEGGGILRAGEGAQIGALTADLTYGATGLQLDDAGASAAFGDEITGVLTLSRAENSLTEISQLTLEGAGLDANVSGTVAGPSSGFEIDATLDASIAGLQRFSTLVGRQIGGAAKVEADILATPLDGLFDVTLEGTTTDLSVGVAEVDRVLSGAGTLVARLVRDTAGTRVERLSINTDAAKLNAAAQLTSNGADADFDAVLSDIGLVVEELDGPATMRGTIKQGAEGVTNFMVEGRGPALNFATSGTVSPAETGQIIAANIAAEARDLRRYAALAGRPIAGAISLQTDATLETEGLLFTADVTAQTVDLVTGIDRLDPLIAGAGQIAGRVTRAGAQSVILNDLRVDTPAMTLAGDADVTVGASSTANLDLRINDIGLLDPSLSGPVEVTLDATPAVDNATDALLTISGPGIAVTLDALVASAEQDYEISGDLDAQVAALSAYATLIGRPVAGSVDLSASGRVLPDLSAFDAQLNLRSEDLEIGNPTADALLAGTGRINAAVSLDDGVLGVRTLEVSTREVTIVGALNGAAGFGQGRFNASLRDVGVLTDQISGPVRATGSAALDEAGNWSVDATGTGPGGLSATVAGQVRQDGTLALDIDGSAPLALANTALDPRRLSGQANFDLSVNGPPALNSLAGQVTFSNGRLAAPNLGQALTDIGGQVRLSGGTAQIDLSTQVDAGGAITVRGPVALTGANQASITVGVNNVVLQDPELYTTEVTGTVTVNGPLQGGARITGRFDLGQTDVRVPSSSISTLGDLPQVAHVGEGAAVRQTLARANALGQGGNGGSDGGSASGGPVYPLDIVINAPSRIFIRGRGLDAELGGRLTIGGTSANVIPVGRFSLVRGRIDILQQRFELDEGVASLQGDFDPFIRLVATTQTDSGTIISIIVEGPAGSPEVRFESIPELPQDEVLARLIFGRDIESISPLQAVQLASAISTLAGRGGGAIDQLRENIGLDDFDVTTDDEGNAAVRAGAYLSENVYTDVTVTSQGETEINLNLDITREITAKGSVDQDGETSIGVFFERDY